MDENMKAAANEILHGEPNNGMDERMGAPSERPMAGQLYEHSMPGSGPIDESEADSELLPPSPSWAQVHGAFPSRGFFALPCFAALARLGVDGASALARRHVVSTPGTLGPDGAWRPRGHRIAAAQIFGAAPSLFEPGALSDSLSAWEARFPHAFDGPHFEGTLGSALRAPVYAAMDSAGWFRSGKPDDPASAREGVEKMAACLCLALAHPDLACAHAAARGFDHFASDLAESLSASQAAWEAGQIGLGLQEAAGERASGSQRL